MMEEKLKHLQAALERWAGREMPEDLQEKMRSIAMEEHWKKRYPDDNAW